MNKKMIRIKAKNNWFSIDETVPEDKAVARLEKIKKMHRIEYGKLAVRTSVVNPTLF